VAGVRDDMQLRLRPHFLQVPRRLYRADDVVPAVDDARRDVADLAVDVTVSLTPPAYFISDSVICIQICRPA
jgi:hypothetical protein